MNNPFVAEYLDDRINNLIQQRNELMKKKPVNHVLTNSLWTRIDELARLKKALEPIKN